MDERKRRSQVLAWVLTELRNRGVKDVFCGVRDGLKGFPQAIEACIRSGSAVVHRAMLLRASLNYVKLERA